jgi:hypothetical protein
MGNDFIVTHEKRKESVRRYETPCITRMHARYRGFTENSAIASVLQHAINLVSVIFAQFYFPCYPNGPRILQEALAAHGQKVVRRVWLQLYGETNGNRLAQLTSCRS